MPIPIVERSQKEIEQMIRRKINAIKDVKACLQIRVGPLRKKPHVHLHVWLDKNLSYEDVHNVASHIEREVRTVVPDASVAIRTEPHGTDYYDVWKLIKDIANKESGSRGAHRMAKQEVVVKRLPSIENLGNMDVLCTDKTGTLTEGNVILKDYFCPDGSKNSTKILVYSLNCSDSIAGGQSTGNPMDIAIGKYATNRNLQNNISQHYIRLSEIPFDFHRRMVSVIVQKGDEIILITKGAPESVLSLCKSVEWDGKIESIGSHIMDEINMRLLSLSQQGYRILAVAYRNIGLKKIYLPDDESNLILAGFLVFADPPKEGAKFAISKLGSLGVNVKVLTGDNESVARKICQELEIPITRSVTGSDLVHMSLN